MGTLWERGSYTIRLQVRRLQTHRLRCQVQWKGNLCMLMLKVAWGKKFKSNSIFGTYFQFKSTIPIECCTAHFRNRKDPNRDEVTDKAKWGHRGRKYSFGPKLTWGHYVFGKVQFIIHFCKMTASHAIIVLNQPIQLVIAWKTNKAFDWITSIRGANLAVRYMGILLIITCWR